jgi:DNA-binding response OmpR family regulator
MESDGNLYRETRVTERKHILLADDEPGFRFSAGLALRMAGYRVSEAQDGLDALDGLVRFKDEGTPVDLLVTDLRMPNLDGAELVDALKRHDVPVPVFVVSGCFDPEALRELSLFGCVEYMEKPFQPSELVHRIDNAFKANVA